MASRQEQRVSVHGANPRKRLMPRMTLQMETSQRRVSTRTQIQSACFSTKKTYSVGIYHYLNISCYCLPSGAGYEWEDDFPLLPLPTSSVTSDSPPPRSTPKAPEPKPAVQFSRFTVSPSNVSRFSITHISDSDMDSVGGASLNNNSSFFVTQQTHNNTQISELKCGLNVCLMSQLFRFENILQIKIAEKLN